MGDTDLAAFEELQAWQKGMEFANLVIELIDGSDTQRKHYGLLEQLAP
jgi:hypothetical protein